MTERITAASLIAAAGNATAAPTVHSAYNGSLGTVDLCKPVDYTDDFGKVIVTNGKIDLARQLDYVSWIAKGKITAATAFTDLTLATVLPIAREAIARDRVYSVFDAAQVPITIRTSDIFEYAKLPTAAINARERDELYAALTADEDADGKVATVARWILHAIIANAIHRYQNDGHNWFTADTKRLATPTGRIISVAGKDRNEFADYMSTRGHDGNHHLADTSLYAMADALTDDQGPIIVTNPFPYLGTNISGMYISKVFILSDAAKDRWPADQLGKSALIVGLNIAAAVVTDFTTKVLVTGAGSVATNASTLATAVASATLSRAEIVSMNSDLLFVLALCHGYAVTNGILTDDQFKAFDKHANRSPYARATGISLANAVRACTPHDAAVTTSIVAAINSIASALESAAAHTANATLNAHDATAVTATVGTSSADRMLALIAKTNP